MASHNHHHNHHDHHHGGEADFDPGIMYKEAWVQDLVRKIQDYTRSNSSWLGLKEESSEQRVLDYACGHGTISLALVEKFPNATFQGIDIHEKQVQRFNEEARQLTKGRMYAVVGDLTASPPELDKEEWFEFDVAIMSMALHHVTDPVDMLVRLRKRLRTGGTLMLVEWFDNRQGTPLTNEDKRPHSDSDAPRGQKLMIDTVGGQQIWPGFTSEALKNFLVAAGFRLESVDVRIPGITFRMPEELVGAHRSGENALVFVKAVAP